MGLNEINKAIATVDDSNNMLTELLKSSIAKEENERARMQQTGKKLVQYENTIKVLKGFVCKWLDEFEGAWDNNETCESPEIARDYLDQAKFMRALFNRDDAGTIKRVQYWYDNYLPFP